MLQNCIRRNELILPKAIDNGEEVNNKYHSVLFFTGMFIIENILKFNYFDKF